MIGMSWYLRHPFSGWRPSPRVALKNRNQRLAAGSQGGDGTLFRHPL